jgi:ribosomal protein L7Ae-like RNA K-turn-binding protein
LVLVASDASLNTKKLFNDKCNYRNVLLKEFETKEVIGKLIGKENRAVIAVIDEGFSKAVLKLFEDLN